MRQPAIIFIVLFLTTAFLTLSSCTHSDEASSPADDGTMTAAEARQLAQSDHDRLNSISFENNSEVSSEVRASAAQFFGGLKGSDLQSYLDLRIKYFLSKDELDQMTFPDIPSSVFSSPGDQTNSSDAQVIAANIGGALWEMAAANGYPNGHVKFRDLTLAIDNPRVGLMLIGPGYLRSVKTSDGTVIPIPVSYRQATLLHEARHSDCTGGLGKADLETLKKNPGSNQMENIDCLHRHVLCPAGHEYQFLPACDSKPWGAYTASAIFSAMSTQALTGQDKRIMQMKTADQLTRLLFDTDKMFSGELGPPDLSSSGVIQ